MDRQEEIMESQQEFLIGDMAEIAGISRDTLRFYEKKGIVQARKKENGYRFYSKNDIYKLVHILYHRKMNSSLREIEEIMKMDREDTVCFMRKHVAASIAKEKESMERHRRTVARLQMVERDMRNIEECMGSYTLKRFPEAYIVKECGGFEEGVKEWFQLSAMADGMDISYFYTEIGLIGNRPAIEKTRLLFYKELEPIVSKMVELSDFQELRVGECIYTIVESESILPEEHVIQSMTAWGREKGLATGNKMYVNHMTSFSWDTPKYCLELYMPVIGES
ncbi:MerR family transcriptional regulator [Lachnospiraceae bacterium 62-35]